VKTVRAYSIFFKDSQGYRKVTIEYRRRWEVDIRMDLKKI